MPVGAITKRNVDALKPGVSDQYLWDDQVKGFALKVTPLGARTYLVQYRMGGRGTPTRRYTIGKHGRWNPDDARTEAKKLLQMVDRGEDPYQAKVDGLKAAAETKRREGVMNFAAYVDRYLKEYGKGAWRDGTYRNVEGAFRSYVTPKLGESSLLTIARSDITAMLDAVPAERQALRRSVYAYLRKLFSWSVGRGDIERSPMDGMQAPKATADRERVLTDDEIKAVWTALPAGNAVFAGIVRMLILTGQRRDEVAELVWSELDRKSRTWVLPAARAKNGCEHLVPLSDAVVAELDRIAGQDGVKADDKRVWPRKGLVFPSTGAKAFSSFSKAKVALDKKIGEHVDEGDDAMAPWVLHDLRRTFVTGQQRLGTRLEVGEALVNHVGGSKSGVVGVYARHHWAEEKTRAMKAWADHVLAVTSGQVAGSNVVALHG